MLRSIQGKEQKGAETKQRDFFFYRASVREKTDKSSITQSTMGLRFSKPAETPSERAIRRFVDTLLENRQTNCTFIPDCVEKDLYKNFLLMIFGNLSEIGQSIRLDILNHRITIQIQAIDDDPQTLTEHPDQTDSTA